MSNIITFPCERNINYIEWGFADWYTPEYQELFSLVYKNNNGYGDCQMTKEEDSDEYYICAIVGECADRNRPVNIQSIRSALEQVASLYRSKRHMLDKQWSDEWPTNDIYISTLDCVAKTFSFDEFVAVVRDIFDGVDINIFIGEW